VKRPVSVYLDHAATTPIDPRVAAKMAEAYAEGYANPASQHAEGRRARQALEAAREAIARGLGAEVDRFDADRLILTSGGTEANHLAVLGLARRRRSDLAKRGMLRGDVPPSVVLSSIEHPSVSALAEPLAREGFAVRRLPVGSDGVVQVEALEGLLDAGTCLVSLMLANNETGALQPVERAAALCNRNGVWLHTDAVQAVGKIPVSFRDLGVAAMTLAPHKFHGPRGVGGLLLRSGVEPEPLLLGGFQQASLRAGTEDPALAIGFAEALRLANEEETDRPARLAAARDAFERVLREEIPNLEIHAASNPRLPTTSCVSFPGIDRQALFLALDFAGIACSTGSACASGSSEPSAVLSAIGVSPEALASALRFSFGGVQNSAVGEESARRIILLANDLRRRVESGKASGFGRDRRRKSV
jgi:cysteine desulfurase